MKKAYRYFLSLLMLSALFLTGCGSSGSQRVISPERPENVVFKTATNWRASNSSPSYGNVKLYDLASNSYILTVSDVKVVDTEATVACYFNYVATDSGYLDLVFSLVFDEGKWWLDDVVITDHQGEGPKPVPPTPGENGITGIVKDQNGKAISNATIMVYSVKDLTSVVASTVTNSNGEYSVEVNEGEYIVIAAKDGYTISQAFVTVGETTSDAVVEVATK